MTATMPITPFLAKTLTETSFVGFRPAGRNRG
jgi:hypothetical protein